MDVPRKRRLAFALVMGILTTGIISFVLLAMNLGFSSSFAATWLKSWAIAYVIVIPAILLVGPRLQAWMEQLIQ